LKSRKIGHYLCSIFGLKTRVGYYNFTLKRNLLEHLILKVKREILNKFDISKISDSLSQKQKQKNIKQKNKSNNFRPL